MSLYKKMRLEDDNLETVFLRKLAMVEREKCCLPELRCALGEAFGPNWP